MVSYVEYLADSCLGCCNTEVEATDYLLALAFDPCYETVLSFVRTKWGEIAEIIERKSGIKVIPLEVIVAGKLSRN
ncbi:hypothetical protein HYT57_04240 [Candidatus Woesearchaeota archaeon]|nr:hypothetical protein [Candidatus Woesearchaeota archaeon]